jgi:hypothetical protein
MNLVTRRLLREEWPRLRTTGCQVNQSLRDTATKGFVIVVELGQRIVGTVFVFLTAPDRQTCVDGLWIEESFRGRFAVQRRLRRAIHQAIRQLNGDFLIGWLTPRGKFHRVRV